ncbi:MAG TPA: glycerol kinase [Alphaproteobacteria bacterium]|nr:glycerol kinase [Alphaproteobacteria bacterium]
MNIQKYILAFDIGTSSLRSVLFNDKAKIIGIEQREFKQHYPAKGHVEHDAEEIWQKTIDSATALFKKLNIEASDIAGIGITNQRETTIIWSAGTGKPIYNAIVWQDTRTAAYCNELIERNISAKVKSKTGLVINSYFSASKIRWILDNVVKDTDTENLKFGTIDSWILWKLTGGKIHATDYSNASRTLLYNITELKWDDELLEIFKIPKNILPEVKPTINDFGKIDKAIFGAEIPVNALIGDQQSSLFGQACFEKGEIKSTYGTGCFILKNIGEKPVIYEKGLLTTIAWGIGGKVFYAGEAAIFNCASIINWLKNNLGIIKSGREADELATSVNDCNNVVFISAFSGLSAPYWMSTENAEIFGLTLDTNKAHIVRAAIESIAFQVKDVLEIMENESGIKIKDIAVDGGVSNSDFLMQFQSDLLKITIKREKESEKTACGAAYLAGIKAGMWDIDYIKKQREFNIFTPQKNDYAENSYLKWKKVLPRHCS